MASTSDRILQIVIKAKDQATAALQNAAGGVSGSLSKIREAMGAVGIASAGFLMDAVKTAAAAQEANTNLEQTLKSTGGAAGMTAESLGSLSNALNKSSLFTMGQIKSGEAMLLTFTNIGKNVFPQASQAMLDLSQKMGSDPQQAAIQLGKALNDPVKGITALQRVGVSFTEQQKEQIKTMMKAGDTAGAQKLIIGELNKEFGGQALAATKDYNGQMQMIGKTFAGIKVAIGNQLLPYLQAFATELSDIVTKVATFISAHSKLVAVVLSVTAVFGTLIGGLGFLQKILGIIRPLLGPVSGVISGIGGAIGGLVLPITIVVAAIALLATAYVKNWGGMRDITNGFINGAWKVLQQAFQAVKEWFVANWPTIKAIFEVVLNGMQVVFNSVLLPVLKFMGQELGVVVNWVKANWPLIQQTVTVVLNAIKAVITVVLGAIVVFWRAHGETIMTVVKLAFDNVKTVISTVLNVVLGIIKVVMNLITGHWGAAFKGLIDIVKTILGGLGHIISNILGGVGAIFKDLGRTAISWGEGLINGFVNGIKNVAHKVTDTVKNVIGSVANFLGFHSPAKEGEGQHIVEWGSNMVSGFMQGIQTKLPDMQKLMSTAIKAPPLNASVQMNAGNSRGNSYQLAGGMAGGANQAVTPALQISMAGLFQGANLTIRSEEDIYKIGIETARQTSIRAQAGGMGRGRSL